MIMMHRPTALVSCPADVNIIISWSCKESRKPEGIRPGGSSSDYKYASKSKCELCIFELRINVSCHARLIDLLSRDLLYKDIEEK